LKLELKPAIHEPEKQDSCLLLAEVVQNLGEMKLGLAGAEEVSPHAMFYTDSSQFNAIQVLNQHLHKPSQV